MKKKDEAKKAQAEKVAESKANRRLLTISKAINRNSDMIMTRSLQTGSLLIEANELIKSIGKKQSDFLSWCYEHCMIGKAQAYKLMACYKTFGQDETFSKVPMSILYSLKSETVEVLEKARALAEKGKLDTKALAELTKPVKPEATESSKITSTGGKIIESANTPGSTESAGSDTIPGKFDSAGNNGKVSNKPAQTDAPESGQVIDSAVQKERDQLKSTVTELQNTITELNNQIAALTIQSKKSATQSIPGLLQFKSAIPSVVLGLEPKQEKDKEAVNKAYRALAKVWTATANKEASAALKTARGLLLATIEGK